MECEFFATVGVIGENRREMNMDPVFSHIVQKRLSRENENIATEALAYFLSHSKGARRGMMRLLREVVPEMPDLLSRTQANRRQQPSRLLV